MIELYIENELIELQDDIDVSMTYETIDPDKLSSIKNSFSKTVNIPGTPHNNIVFGHIYRMDKYFPLSTTGRINASYDPHKRVGWVINQNGSVVNQGYCTLDNIKIDDNYKVTYQLTLYGGLGNFFYGLRYDEDGNEKTLYDLYFRWKAHPDTNIWLDPDEELEKTRTLMTNRAELVVEAYHRLDPNAGYDGDTNFETDVVFLPCYSGLPEDFDASHMLVNTFNQRFVSATPVLSPETAATLNSAFPTQFDQDGKTYTSIGATYDPLDAYRYGLAEFAREVDPWEAGDIRVDNLPLAIRLSKLLWTITRPENCGGYDVHWDKSILSSFYWKYSWLTLDKLRSTTEDQQTATIATNDLPAKLSVKYDVYNEDCIDVSPTNGLHRIDYSADSIVDDDFKITQTLKWAITAPTYKEDGKINYYLTFANRRTTKSLQVTIINMVCVATEFRDNGAVKEEWLDIFMFSRKNGYDWYYKDIDTDKIYEYVVNDLGLSHDTPVNMRIHYNGLTAINVENSTVICRQQVNIIDFNMFNYSSVSMSQRMFSLFYETVSFIGTGPAMPPAVQTFIGRYGIAKPSDFGDTEDDVFDGYGMMAAPDKERYTYRTPWLAVDGVATTNISLDISSRVTSVKQLTTPLITDITKEKLFAGTKSPFTYLVDFCKMMNYKFIVDETRKRVEIIPLSRYYKSRRYKIDGKTDRRSMSIKPVVADIKTIEFGLEPLETYPNNILSKLSSQKYDIDNYKTTLEWSHETRKLLDNLEYKSASEWQLSGYFFNTIPAVPTIYNQNIINWTLFRIDQQEQKLEQATIQTKGLQMYDSIAKDWYPKLGLFDKDNKYIGGSTLVFLNGFIKNYDYVLTTSGASGSANPTGKTYTLAPRVLFSNDKLIEYVLNNNKRCYIYDFCYNMAQRSWGLVQTDAYNRGCATSYVLPFFSKMVYNRINSGKTNLQPDEVLHNAIIFRDAPNGINKLVSVPGWEVWIFKAQPEQLSFQGTYDRDPIFTTPAYAPYKDTFTIGTGRVDAPGVALNLMDLSAGGTLSNSIGATTNNDRVIWVNVQTATSASVSVQYGRVNYWYQTNFRPYANWNLVNNSAVPYDLQDTTFIKQPGFAWPLQTTSLSAIEANEYKVTNLVGYDQSQTVYSRNWLPLLENVYDRNAREITASVDLTQFSSAEETLRTPLEFEGQAWVVQKLHNYNIAGQGKTKFTKVTLLKMVDLDRITSL